MMTDDPQVTKHNIRPAMGWVSMAASPYDGLINQTLSDDQVQNLKKKIEEHPIAPILLNEGEGVNLMQLISGQGRTRTITEDEVRTAMAEQMCKFEAGIVKEVGPVPPGYQVEFNTGDKVFFHEGKGIDIGDTKLMTIDSIIGWSDD
jgi:hypothetical protein